MAIDIPVIAAAAVPILCIDTCSILDIMRDPTRETAKPYEHKAAIELLTAAEAGDLVCLMAEQVRIEFAQHDQNIQDEAERNLRKVCEQIQRINQLSTVYGAPGTIDLSHLNGHVGRARTMVGRWLAQLRSVTPSPSVHMKAFARMNAGRAPATQGKESSKDCLVYETYLEVAENLRAASGVSPIVFLSSNTREYFTEGRILKPDIASEFGKINVKYAPNMSAAKFELGF